VTYLLRVELPDVPGSLGLVATAIGTAGADIEVLEIVEHRPDGTAIDDVIVELNNGALPDTIVSACNDLDGVNVLWISRFAGNANLFRDLELIEELSGHPASALERLVTILPAPFRANWAARVAPAGVVAATESAPSELEWVEVAGPTRLAFDHDDTQVAATPIGEELVMIGREGGPGFLDSELARLAHLAALAKTLARG
jgi:hypothetical protein